MSFRFTGSSRLQPNPRLFATLDVAEEMARLPSGKLALEIFNVQSSGITVVVVDTIGFLSSLPPQLIAAFHSTLKHVLTAVSGELALNMIQEVVVHIRDASHPNREEQSEEVVNTLVSIGLEEPRVQAVVTVDNKVWSFLQQDVFQIDLVEDLEKMDDKTIWISCETGEGIAELIEAVDKV